MLDRELPNLRAGLIHDLATDPAQALRTAGLLEWYWLRGSHIAEGMRLLGEALAQAPDADPVDRARGRSCRWTRPSS